MRWFLRSLPEIKRLMRVKSWQTTCFPPHIDLIASINSNFLRTQIQHTTQIPQGWQSSICANTCTRAGPPQPCPARGHQGHILPLPHISAEAGHGGHLSPPHHHFLLVSARIFPLIWLWKNFWGVLTSPAVRYRDFSSLFELLRNITFDKHQTDCKDSWNADKTFPPTPKWKLCVAGQKDRQQDQDVEP